MKGGVYSSQCHMSGMQALIGNAIVARSNVASTTKCPASPKTYMEDLASTNRDSHRWAMTHAPGKL